MAQATGVHSTRVSARPSPSTIKVTARPKKRALLLDRRARERLEAAVERVIALMDVIDALSEELEETDEDGPGEDDEPSLGAAENLPGRQGSARWGEGDQTNWAASDDRDLGRTG